MHRRVIRTVTVKGLTDVTRLEKATEEFQKLAAQGLGPHAAALLAGAIHGVRCHETHLPARRSHEQH